MRFICYSDANFLKRNVVMAGEAPMKFTSIRLEVAEV